ncbi:MAG TPA: T9SS type A sorting domain-containing protein, partial [Bacteroidota bacterium]|nr:T9SS type A sorting domain-containing protein [Bacteroidota bacterium]
PVAAGWNMIGSISAALPFSGVTSIPPGIVSSLLYAYTDGYHPTDTIRPGFGYWLRTSQPGVLVLGNGSSLVPKSGDGSFAGASKLSFSDVDGREQALYLLDGTSSPRDGALYALPPVPPSGGFDVRFASGRIAQSIGNTEFSPTTIIVSSAHYPLSVRWETTPAFSGVSLSIGTVKHSLGSSGEATVASANERLSIDAAAPANLPGGYALYDAYPNPFNPVATIRYRLPVRSRVYLAVYDILGQQIATLVNGLQAAGIQTAVWNSVQHASGVYVVRFEAGASDGSGSSARETMKIVLQK